MHIYNTKKYISNERLSAFIEQFKYVDEGDVILEIGKGSGLFGHISASVAKYYSIDIDPALNPDYVFDIAHQECLTRLPEKIDKIFCCQVLEHMPFEKSMQSLQNIFSLGANTVCISVPDNRKYIRFNILMPRINLKKVFSVPFSGKEINFAQHGLHYWEIFSGNKCKVEREIEHIAISSNYYIYKHYRLFERPYQHFYIFKGLENNCLTSRGSKQYQS